MAQLLSRRTVVRGLTLGGSALAFSRFPAFAGDEFMIGSSTVSVNPVQHASLWLSWGGKSIIADPVGDAAAFSDAGTPDLILITHFHGDHFDVEVLLALAGPNTQFIAPPSVAVDMPEPLAARTTVVSNGDNTDFDGLSIDAIPAYNNTEGRMHFHPEGRDNGYVLSDGEATVYIAGDTEDIPEMRALTGVDIAFVPMNLPYTMDVNQAASGVAEFAPKAVYPYHYRGSDTGEFARLVADANPDVEVRLHDWYA